MTETTVAKLEEGFLMGLTDREACLYADINPSTLYRYCEENPDFSERKEHLKENVKMIAKKNIYTEIGAGDKQLSQWYTERRDPDFNPKQQIDHTTKGEKIDNSDAVRELTQKLNGIYRSSSLSSNGEPSSALDDKA